MQWKTIFTAVVALMITTAAALAFTSFQQRTTDNDSFEKLWEKVEELEKAGKPQSALEYVLQIKELALEQENEMQLVKAVTRQAVLTMHFEEEPVVKAITIFRNAISLSEDKATRAIFHSHLGGMYSEYYRRNKHFISGRTAFLSDTSQDIRQWPAERIIREAVIHYQRSVDEADVLSATPLKAYEEIIRRPPKQKPVLRSVYDLLAKNALEFYAREPLPLVKAGGMSKLDDSRFFKTGSEFLNFSFPVEDNDYRLMSMDIYQNLYRIHKEDKNPLVLVIFELQRLGYVRDKSIREDAGELYRFSLERFLEKYSEHESSARIQYKLASYWDQKGEQYDPLQGKEHKWDKVKAKEYCEAAISAYPGSHGAKQCRVLLEKLLKPGFSLEMDYACIPNSPSIASLQYKNTDKVFLSLYEIKHSQWEELNRRGREKIREALKNRDAIKNWHISPEDDKDLQQHRVEVDIPALATGHYVLLASSDHDLETDSANSIYNSFFVTDLSLYMHSLNHEKHEGYVSGLQSGKPVEEAEIRLYKRDYDYNSRSYRDNLIKKIHTDKDGYFNVPAEKDKTVHYRVALRKEDDHYVVPERFSLYGHRSQRAEKERIKTYLYTDRAIYRPGQKVYFKGIVLGFRGDDHKIREDFSASIKLMDVNGEQVERIDVQTNEYGSFNGSFVLPSSGLTGRFQLRGEHGSKTIRVEEYKRPRFEVELQQVEEPFRLGDEVVMKGKATAYAGNSISDARVRYEVKRKPEYEPLGYGYGFFIPRPSQGEEVTVSHGEVKTDEQGNFDISFIAVPGERKGEHINTIFRYKVTADVTGISGETRSDSRTVSAGEKALLLDINIPEKVEQTEPMVYRLKTENLDGAQVPAEGELKIERLKQPKRLLKNRRWDVPDKYVLQKQEFVEKFPHEQYKTELDKPSWKTEEEVFGCEFNTKKTDSMIMNCAADWEEGVYRITITSRDIFGRRVKKEKYFTLYDPQSKKMPEKTWLWTEINKSSAEPGEEVELIVGSAAKDAKVRFSYGMNGKLLHDEQITLSENKQKLSIPVKESWRGGFFIYLMMTKEGVVYHKEYRVAVPYTNKKLETQLLTFRDKLKPGSSESWKLRLRGPEGEAVAAEMLASMYDASLDQFVTHKWGFDYLSNNYAGRRKLTPSGRSSSSAYLNMTHRKYHMPQGLKMEQFDHFQIHMQRHKFGLSNSGDLNMVMEAELQEMPMIDRDNEKPEGIFMKKKIEDTVPQTDGEASPKVRTDFSETAFFYPSLETDKNGDILLEFTMPEAVTRWNLMTLSHSRDLKSDILTRTVQTQKELMVMPNMPRFLRESDTIIVSSTISNLSEDTLTGQARIKLFNPENMQEITGEFRVDQQQKPFTAAQGGNTGVSWKMVIPEGYGAVTWRILAETEGHSDGEEGLLPVLPNRMMVTEAMPMSVRSNTTKDFTFDKLKESGTSSTLKHHRYTLEVTQNPAWYAVQALPYLAEFPHECSEQIFSRYYANSLASNIVNSDPKIKRVFDIWRNIEPDALKSQLEKNEELKSVILSETPWLMEAKSQEEQKRRIALLFDRNTMRDQRSEALRQLEEMQLDNGAWPWFGGSYPNRYISQHIVAGFGHLKALGVDDIMRDRRLKNMLEKAVYYLDKQITEDLKRLKKYDADLDDDHLGSLQVHYLYTRSFFFDEFPVRASAKEAYDYYYKQAQQYWLKQNLYLQGMLALAMYRDGEEDLAEKVLASIRDKALHDEEMGMYWRKNRGYSWTQAAVERQALLIEAFDEILQDKESVEEMRLWMLKQKQTQDWGTTKATVKAIYALLLRGKDLLSAGDNVKVTVGQEVLNPAEDQAIDTEAGTGYFKRSWRDVKPEMGNVKFENQGESVAWGAVYWQYFEQLDKISGHDSPLSLNKKLYKEVKTETGRKLRQINDETLLEPGDRIKVRVILSTDRDMEFVHLKDMRAAGLEPVNVLSSMKYQDGLRYYESTKDAATHFFFDQLPKGKYVFEYPLLVAQKGNFSNGITTVQCMYAPEFSAHSEGVRVKVKE